MRHAVVVRAEVDGILIDTIKQKPGDLGQPCFGVTIGGGIVAIDIAEIALAIDERIARGKVLRQAHQRVIDRLVAMGMEIAHDVADDLGRFFELGARIEAEKPHPIEDTPMDGFQAVPRVRKRAVHDGRERISEITLFKRLAQRDLVHRTRLGGNRLLIHGSPALRCLNRPNKG
jgi:hypothetical protein